MANRRYPPIGSTVTVTYRGKAGEATYTGTVYDDRYPDNALNLGVGRIPWTSIIRITNEKGAPS